MVERILSTKADFLHRHAPEIPEGGDIFTKLRVQGTLFEEFALTDPRIEGFIYHLSTRLPAGVREKVDALIGTSSTSRLRDMVRTAVARGEIRNDLPVDFITQLLSFLFGNFSRIFIETGARQKMEKETIIEDFQH